MFQYRQVLVRLRQGDSDRDIARSRLMGRKKVGKLRERAEQRVVQLQPRCALRARGWIVAWSALVDPKESTRAIVSHIL